MFSGVFALILRYILMLGGSALVTAGVMTGDGSKGYCLELTSASNLLSDHLITAVSGGAAIGLAIFWRFWAKLRGGVT